MTIQQIKNFITVVDLGSFTKAEEVSCLSRQALKKQIDQLETELEFKLLLRNTKGIRLTEAGQIFYHSCVKSLHQFDLLLEQCHSFAQNATRLRVGVPPHSSILMDTFLAAFIVKHPDICVENITVRDHIAQKIIDRQIDVAEFVYRPQELPEGVCYQKIMDLDYYCVVQPSHPLAQKTQLTARDIEDYPISLSFYANRRLRNYLLSVSPEIRLSDMQIQSRSYINNVCFNNGIFISKGYFAHNIHPFISIPFLSPVSYECGVVYLPEMSAPVSYFLDLIKEYYQ